MEIKDIKARLSIETILNRYNIKTDRHHKTCCPFHVEKTPSFQVYYKTHKAYCFSSNCKTHGKSLDVIDFIMYKEGWDTLGADGKHKAIEKAKEIAGLPAGRHMALTSRRSTTISLKPQAPPTTMALEFTMHVLPSS